MSGEEVSSSCGQASAPTPTGRTKPQPVAASEQERLSTGFKMYVSPKCGGTICHTPYIAALSVPPVPVISAVVVESLCHARPVQGGAGCASPPPSETGPGAPTQELPRR